MFVGIGNPVYDFIKTPQITTGTRVLSGGATNSCLALSKMGETAYLVGCIGPDFEDQFTADLEHYGIGYQVYPTKETGGFSLIYDEQGDRTLDVLGIASPIPDLPDVIKTATCILVGPILGEVSLSLLEQLHAVTDAPIMLDPQGFLRRVLPDGQIERYCNPDVYKAIQLCDVVKANEHEAYLITGTDPSQSEKAAQDAVQSLFEIGCETAIVTLAANGSIIYDGNELVRVPAYHTNAVDPTGAGDTYAAGFAIYYLEGGHSLREAGFFASCVASVMVENTGPHFPLTRQEADSRTRQLLVRDVEGESSGE